MGGLFLARFGYFWDSKCKIPPLENNGQQIGEQFVETAAGPFFFLAFLGCPPPQRTDRDTDPRVAMMAQ